MKAVLISIQPKWCELIASGKKTIEVRKTRPKIETPFKCYIYCTIGNGVKGDYLVPSGIQCGKVIGEFVCNRITEYDCDKTFSEYCVKGYVGAYVALIEMCLNQKELIEYGKGETLYGWNISDLKIYDKPKELGEFKKPLIFDNRPMKDWCHNHCEICDEKNCKYDLRITRPPQSWQHVEELEV